MERPIIYVIASQSQHSLTFCRRMNSCVGRKVFEPVPIDYKSFLGREGKTTDIWVLRGEAFTEEQSKILMDIATWPHLSFYDMSHTL